MRTNDSQKTWTDRLNEALALRGKSPADISKATGITPAGIKKWIDGDVSKPKFDDVFAVCSFLDITTEWLMKGVSVRVGNTAGRSVSTDVPVKFSASQIVLTTKSLYYFESESPKRILFKNIIGADIVNNGYSIKVVQEGVRAKPVCFNFDSTVPPSLIRQIITTDW